MQKYSTSDSLFEALLSQAVKDDLDNRIRALPSEAEAVAEFPFSDRHIARMKRLFARDLRHERLRAAAKWVYRAAVIVLLAVTVTFGVLLTSPEVRAAVSQTVIEWFDQFALFTPRVEAQATTRLEPAYLPDGYFELDRFEMDDITFVVYTNEGGSNINLLVQPVRGSKAVDHEELPYNSLFIEGIEYHIFTGNSAGKISSVIWERNGNRYEVSADLSAELLLKIAQSVQ